MQVPAPLRAGVATGCTCDVFILGPGPGEETLALYTEDWFNARSADVLSAGISDADYVDFMEYFYSQVVRVELDKQGRLVLPEALHAHIGLAKEVVLSGSGQWITVRSKEKYRDFVTRSSAQRLGARQRFFRNGAAKSVPGVPSGSTNPPSESEPRT
ncbi:MAG TPA: division/cell wall cluster transcriptional repressor MraZ [Phycisphaerae bacterium]